MREKILINHGWRFLANPGPDPVVKTKAGMYLSAKTERLKWGPGNYQHIDIPEHWSDKELTSERWQTVDVPHDYIINEIPEESETNALGYVKSYPAWYRKHLKFNASDADRRLTIYFEGITGISDVYFNGCFLKHNDGGYVSFEVDITDLVRLDEDNVLAVHVNPDSYETWWYAGGGIYRNVWLVKTDMVAIDLWGVFLPVRKLDAARWQVPVEVTLKNVSFEDAPVEISCDLFAPNGGNVGTVVMKGDAKMQDATTFCGATTLVNPQLWDIDTPQQYTAKVTVSRLVNGKYLPCDNCEQRFGFREIVMDADQGFFLNGRHIKLQGLCGHLDFGLTGKAVPNNICKYKMKLYKQMGANAFRTSHYPHQEAVMDACDELGILVMDETRRFESNDDALAQMAMLVKRDRNRPCVFIWSTGNEEPYQRRQQGIRIHKALEHVAHKLDPTRLVTSAADNPKQVVVYDACEVIGSNYSLPVWPELHAKYPDRPMFSSENCAVGSTRGWYYGDDPVNGRLDARDRNPVNTFAGGREKTWQFIMSHPWLMGGFQWDAVEHRGEAAWPRVCSVSGAIDLFLQKKDAFYQNLSHWSTKPMIHVLPHWNHKGMDNYPVNVWVYTNCEEAELKLNGISLGRQCTANYTHAEWTVPYQPGRLEAIGYNHGIQQVVDIQETTGPAVGLKLQLENAPVFANGEDIAFFTCTAVDAQGREVPDAEPFVKFSCTGVGRLVGTGSSNTDHVPPACPDRQMYAGRISVAVKLGTLPPDANQAPLTLVAQAASLESAIVTLELTRER